MMRGIVGSSLQFRYLVIVLAGVLMLSGVSQLREMPVDVLPEFSPPFVEIQTEALGLSAEEVEQMITVPMEQDLLAGVAWLDVIRSESVPGLSSVLIYFEPGTDLYRARQMVAERLAQAAVGLPHVSKPPTMIQPTSSASRFMIIGLSSDELSLIEMSVLARWTIGPRLMGVPGVANVSIWGNRERQLQVLVDPERLQALGVSLEQVVETTGNALWVSPLSFLEASSPGTGGFIDTPNQRLGIWHVLPISSPEDLAQVPVEGTILTLGEVAEIVEDHQPLIGDALVNDNPNLMLVIEKLPEANTLEVTRGVEDALDSLRPGFTSIDFDATLFRPATFIETAIANLTRAMVIGALLACLFLGVFFYGWRAAVISLAAVLLSLVTALFVLHLRGMTLNTMALAGLVIALGLIVDEAVVDVEHIMQRLRQNRRDGSPRSPESVVLVAATGMRENIFFVILVTLLVILPVFSLEGIPGAIFQPMAVSYALAVLAAMVVALTTTPVLCLLLLANVRVDEREARSTMRLREGYEKALTAVIRKPRLAYASIVVFIVASLAVLPFLRRDQMLPAFREPYMMVHLEGPPGTSRLEMDRIVGRVSSELRAIPGVSNVGAHVGRAIFGDQVVGINSAELWVSIAPEADYDSTITAIQEVVNGYPGLQRSTRTYLQETLGQPQMGASDPFTVRVYGEDYAVLREEAEKLRQVVSSIDGVVDSHVILPLEEPTLEIEVDLSVAQHYGIKPGDVRRGAAILLSGLQVGSLFEEQKVFDVIVWSTPETRRSLTDIRELLIDTPSGGHVLLDDVADVRVMPAPTVIQREAISPYLDIGFNIRGRNVNAVISDIGTALHNFAFPLEYHAEIQEDYAMRQATRQRILFTALLAAFGIFLLLQSACAGWGMGTATFLTLPAALAGGLLAAFLGGITFSLSSLFGLIAVFGISMRNSILLIKHYQSLEQAGESFGPNLVLRGSRERLAPMVTTVLATGLALLPFVLFGNIPGYEVARPIAIVILGGLVTSTLFNLLLLPSLYLRFGETGREADLGLAPVPASD
ncbi:MAG: efflux RND transporter permease subunit [Chloroflexota bacterium]